MLSIFIFVNAMVWEILPAPLLLYLGESFKMANLAALLLINRSDHFLSTVIATSSLVVLQIPSIVYLILHRATASKLESQQSPPVNLLLTSFSILTSSSVAIWILIAALLNNRALKKQQAQI